jgi:hypothetical protein
MLSKAITVDAYLKELPEDRQMPVAELRKVILKNLPKGFKEVMSNGMIGYVVPHSIYPAGYHCDAKQPLPFACVASQKNAISLYHMGVYANPKLLKWFTEEYTKADVGKLDMGKSCIRFKKPDAIPYKLIGELISKVTVDEWISTYEKNLKK